MADMTLTTPQNDHSANCPCGGKTRIPGESEGWPRLSGPGRLLAKRDGSEKGVPPGWADHTYRIRDEEGAVVFVAEPYEMSVEAISDIAWLVAEHGYRFHATSWEARHYPGSTLAIHLQPPVTPRS